MVCVIGVGERIREKNRLRKMVRLLRFFFCDEKMIWQRKG